MKKFPLISKEVSEVLLSKTSLIYFILLFSITSYSFYSAVDLYSKASVAAIGNPLYAAGFEPVPGVFIPTFGGLFMIFSLIAPFLLIRSLGVEKTNNTLPMIFQLPYSIRKIFLIKLFSAMVLIVVSILFFSPLLFFWKILGGHIPRGEIILLASGYFLYGLFVISVSFFSSTLFRSSSQASIFSLAVIMFSWFVDFGKEMNVIPLFSKFSDLTTTKQLKIFESGIISFGAVFYFLLLFFFFSTLTYIFFNINLKNKIKEILISTVIFTLLFGLVFSFRFDRDVTESGRNSFSFVETQFLKKMPAIDIEVFLDPIDGRFKDYENDFLKKLKMAKRDIVVHFAKGKDLKEKYGLFRYTLNGKTKETYSNSAEEIFMLFEGLSGIKVGGEQSDLLFRGYPLVVRTKWSGYLFALYLIIFPFIMLLFYYRKNIFYRRKKHENRN